MSWEPAGGRWIAAVCAALATPASAPATLAFAVVGFAVAFVLVAAGEQAQKEATPLRGVARIDLAESKRRQLSPGLAGFHDSRGLRLVSGPAKLERARQPTARFALMESIGAPMPKLEPVM